MGHPPKPMEGRGHLNYPSRVAHLIGSGGSYTAYGGGQLRSGSHSVTAAFF